MRLSTLGLTVLQCVTVLLQYRVLLPFLQVSEALGRVSEVRIIGFGVARP